MFGDGAGNQHQAFQDSVNHLAAVFLGRLFLPNTSRAGFGPFPRLILSPCIPNVPSPSSKARKDPLVPNQCGFLPYTTHSKPLASRYFRFNDGECRALKATMQDMEGAESQAIPKEVHYFYYEDRQKRRVIHHNFSRNSLFNLFLGVPV